MPRSKTPKKPNDPQVKVKINATMGLSELRWFLEGIRSAYYYDLSDSPIIEQLRQTLKKAESEDKNSTIGRRMQSQCLEKYGDEYAGPEYYFFAVRATDNSLFDDPEVEAFELHVCFKWDWYLNNQKYPYGKPGYLDEFNLQSLGERVDGDGVVSWWEGNADNARDYLIKLGFEEKLSLLSDYDEIQEQQKVEREKRLRAAKLK